MGDNPALFAVTLANDGMGNLIEDTEYFPTLPSLLKVSLNLSGHVLLLFPPVLKPQAQTCKLYTLSTGIQGTGSTVLLLTLKIALSSV